MIGDEILQPIGKIGKPHGINGEMNLSLNDDFLDSELTPDDLRCIVLDIEGIKVPFFINGWRPRNTEDILLSIDGIDNEVQAKELTGKTVYALTEDYSPVRDDENGDGMYASDLIGFTVSDENDRTLGVISDVEDSTDNTLFIIRRPDSDKPLYIPVVDEFITSVDPEAKHLSVSLPEGLVEL